MKIVIEGIENGWIVTQREPTDGWKDKIIKTCFEIQDGEEAIKNEAESFKTVLYHVIETVGPKQDQFGDNVIHISIGPGDETS